IPPADTPWGPSRVLYLLHPSDPIIWWSPGLMVKRPDWLREPRGPDVLGAMVWIPFVTFWQVTADLPLGMKVPPGYGHVYTGEHVDGWVALLQPEGWSADKSARLRELLKPEP
ncbi:alpha/beta-hydrolase family protein, partial [Corallococcus sp. bb12-1]|uniref:alpha/beta-hydrolase family protein n=1 Tax=Corallococcus sp. bb12-1 TaxID=2996784 RepID=UPI00226F0ACA